MTEGNTGGRHLPTENNFKKLGVIQQATAKELENEHNQTDAPPGCKPELTESDTGGNGPTLQATWYSKRFTDNSLGKRCSL